ncbi:membrane bound O-acyl transferase family-domain-containing protein [Cyathus striatus]|nr:membrane bound O-acyl transferase family-domain-containing protein [Cyathus striatus]
MNETQTSPTLPPCTRNAPRRSRNQKVTYRPVSFILALAIFISIFTSPYEDANPSIRLAIGFFGSYYLGTAFDLLVLQHNPHDTLTHKKHQKPVSQLSFPLRVSWSYDILFNSRAVGWNCAFVGLRYPQYTSRRKYVLEQFFWIVFYYLLVDLANFIGRRSPAFQYPPLESVDGDGFVVQLINVGLFWGIMAASTEFGCALDSGISVAIGVSDPEDAPAYFGVWSKTKSARIFWGRTWHQSLRRSIQPQSKYFTQNVLHLPPKSLKAKYIELFMCFSLSGIYHAAGDWLAMRNPSTALATFGFFALQAVIIALDDILIYIGGMMGIGGIPGVFSYVWVIGWMTLTTPIFANPVLMAGLGRLFVLPSRVSVMERLWDKFAVGLS